VTRWAPGSWKEDDNSGGGRFVRARPSRASLGVGPLLKSARGKWEGAKVSLKLEELEELEIRNRKVGSELRCERESARFRFRRNRKIGFEFVCRTAAGLAALARSKRIWRESMRPSASSERLYKLQDQDTSVGCNKLGASRLSISLGAISYVVKYLGIFGFLSFFTSLF